MKLSRSTTLTALLVLVALIVGSVIGGLFPTAEEIFNRPFERRAEAGEPVTLRTGTVTVHALAAAQEVETVAGVASTTGVWLVVDLTWVPSGKPTPLGVMRSRLEAPDGRRFGGALLTTCGPGQPGIELSCQIAFEVTADALPGARLLIPAEVSLAGADDVAVIDLGIEGDRAADLASPTERIVMAEPQEAVR